MRTVRSHDPSLPVKDRLGTRLALLFVGTFLGVLIFLIAWTMFATIADRRLTSAESDIAAPPIVIDPKIQSELSKALAFDALPASTEVQNPFVDRAGLSGAVVVSTATSTPQKINAAGSGSGTTQNPGASSPQTIFSQGGAASTMEPTSALARYQDWLARQRRGEPVGPESEVLGVEDLVPVGYASGGDRGAEVILFSLALCRSFTFAPGTRFANGWLNEFDAREVVFTFQNGIRRKSYSTAEPCQPSVDSRSANAGDQ